MKEILNNAKARMEKTLGVLSSDFASIRAGRANPAVLDRITVDYYGTQTPINQMAAISVSDARVLVIQPWDKTSLKAIEKAIRRYRMRIVKKLGHSEPRLNIKDNIIIEKIR